MEPTKFKTGDVVELKSGSPRLTVSVDQTPEGVVHTVYYDGYGEFKYFTANADALKRVD